MTELKYVHKCAWKIGLLAKIEHTGSIVENS